MSPELPLEGYFLEESAVGFGEFVTAWTHPKFGPGWVRFGEAVSVLTAEAVEDVAGVIEEAESQVAKGLYAAGFVSYDAAPAFDPAFAVRRHERCPLACFNIYASRPTFYKELAAGVEDAGADWQPEVDREWFLERCQQVRRHLEVGDSYQVNLSFRLRAHADGSVKSLFFRLAGAEPPPYASLILSDSVEIASLSPELFFERSGGRIWCRPMKGTAPVGEGAADWLKASEKDRAENLMIVDMIRNDLGKIARVGSVRTTSLFDVEAFSTLLQMTSTVEAEFDGGTGEVFQALFPCASIVGAPKVKAMEIIRDLEASPRGVYTGAVGFMGPGGNARFSVAIRTISGIGGDLEYGAGSGIVWDSEPEAEWRETILKTEALKAAGPEWGLIETFRWPDRTDPPLIQRHLDRLERSVHELKIPFDRGLAEKLIWELGDETLRVRLTLRRSGELALETWPWQGVERLTAGIARTPVSSDDRSLRFKTNRRRIYDRALRESGYEEALLWNEGGEATEFCKGNLVVRFAGHLYTPRLQCGLLPGVMRGWLLSSGQIEEDVITLEELEGADEIFRVNSLTGWVPVDLKKM